MGIMDNEKTFLEERNYIEKNRIMSVLENVNKRFHGYYAEDEKEALMIVKELMEKFDEEFELSGGYIVLV